MGRIRHKRRHHSSGNNPKYRTRNYARDLDQIYSDLTVAGSFENQPIDEDLPGLGKFYCIACAKYFESNAAIKTHRKGKPHKKRLKLLEEEPYSQREADAAIGLSVDNGKGRKDVDEMDDIII